MDDGVWALSGVRGWLMGLLGGPGEASGGYWAGFLGTVHELDGSSRYFGGSWGRIGVLTAKNLHIFDSNTGPGTKSLGAWMHRGCAKDAPWMHRGFTRCAPGMQQ